MSQRSSQEPTAVDGDRVAWRGGQSAARGGGGDTIDGPHSQGFINKPSGTVNQYWGDVTIIQTPTGTGPLSMGGNGGASSSLAWALLGSQFEQLAARMSGETERNLGRMRAAWREGRKREVHDWLEKLRQDQAVWTVLAADLKAKVLCFEGMLAIGNR